MTDQLALVPDAPPKLTDRQQAAYDLIAQSAGVTASQIGQNWHAQRGRHTADIHCEWCDQDGRDVVRSKALRELVTYRRTEDGNLYVLRGTSPARAVTDGYDPATAPIPF